MRDKFDKASKLASMAAEDRFSPERHLATTPLLSAICKWPYTDPLNLEAIRALIDDGADVEETPKHGNPRRFENFRTPLVCACDLFYLDLDNHVMENFLCVVTMLLDAGADPDRAGLGVYLNCASMMKTPLCVACGHKKIELVRLLLSRGASVDRLPGPSDMYCYLLSPLQCVSAQMSNRILHPHPNAPPASVRDVRLHESIIRMLLAAGADIDLGSEKLGKAKAGRPADITFRLSTFEFARPIHYPRYSRDCSELRAIIRAHLARNLRATARGSQVWAPRVASFLI